MSKKISDYTNYNYKKDFWENKNRTYEDICEKQVIKSSNRRRLYI